MAGIVCSVILNVLLGAGLLWVWRQCRQERLRVVTLVSFLVHAHKELFAGKRRAFEQLVTLQGRIAQFLQAVDYEKYIPKLRKWKYTVKPVRRRK